MPTFFTDAYTATLDILDLLPWWAHWLSGLFAVLGILLRFRWLLALVPVAGPILLMLANIAVGLLKAFSERVLVPYLKLLGHGAYKALTTPHGIVISITGAMVFILVGIVIGVKLTGHLVVDANGERDQAQIERDAAQTQLVQLEKSYAAEQDRTNKAAEARKSAEAEADAAKRAGRAVSAELKRLRNGGSTAPAGAGSPKEADGFSLFKGLPALPWGGQ
jgi:hypothetical protein